MTENVLQVRDMHKSFAVRQGARKLRVAAVRGVSFTVPAATTLAVVGESGSGKSTTARLALQLIRPDAGRVLFRGADLTTMGRAELRAAQRRMPMVFQDPMTSLDPTWVIGDSLTEGAALVRRMDRRQRHELAAQLLELVGLPASLVSRYPYELSGGQRQRVGIGRALALEPDLIVCDEAVSALDVSTRAGILELLQGLQRDRSLAYLFISHDLGVVEAFSDQVAVMYLGRIVEEGPTRAVYAAPAHPYTRALIDAAPVADPQRQRSRRRTTVRGEIPSSLEVPAGCAFSARCPIATDLCRTTDPAPVPVGDGTRTVACHHPLAEAPRASSAPERTTL